MACHQPYGGFSRRRGFAAVCPARGFPYNGRMGAKPKADAGPSRALRLSVVPGLAAPVLALMTGLLVHAVFYAAASGIPALIRQDAHVDLALCGLRPDLYGCEPWVGVWTGLEIAGLADRTGKACGWFAVFLYTAIFSARNALRIRSADARPGLVTGLTGVLPSLLLALVFDVPFTLNVPWGAFGIATAALLPVSGLAGGWAGLRMLRRREARAAVRFLPGEGAALPAGGENLTPRELEVLALVAEGRRNREIARRLFINEATVKTHLIHVFSKLGAGNRTEAVARALDGGLLRREEREADPG